MESTLNPSADEVIAKEEAFALWNPTAAALWSLLLSPALGAWLLKRNWERLGHPDKAGGAFGWFFFVIGLNVANLGMILAAPRFEWDFDGLPAWVGLAVFGVWCCLSAYPQIRYVDDHIGEAYPRRSWAAPILIAIMATALFLAVMALLVSATS